jgi:hypothetical protein
MSKLPVKILTPVGMMGYGYEVDKAYKGIQLGATAIIIDAGSSDSGPQKLALNERKPALMKPMFAISPTS